MAILTTKARKAIPSSKFAGPDRSYPIEDRSHAGNAKARAKQQLNRGNLEEYDRIVSKADRVLGQSMK
jgi:hypothetical protein